MITTFILAMCILALIQPTAEKKTAAAALAIASISHYLLFDKTADDVMYYVSAGVGAAAALSCLCSGKRSWFKDNIVGVCFASVLVNFYGLAIYGLGMEPGSYNVASMGLYALAIIILIRGSGYGPKIRHWLFTLPSLNSERGAGYSRVCGG